MNKTNTIGIDLAKNIFHLCIHDGQGNQIQKLKFGRGQFTQFLATAPVSGLCLRHALLRITGVGWQADKGMK